MKKHLFILLMICCVTAASAQKQRATDSVKIKKQLRVDSIKRANQVYTKADINPSFPGGDNGLLRYIKENMQYPTRDREDNTQGKAYVRFVVEKDGSISNVHVVKAPSTTMSMEAERLVKNMPKWAPGLVSTRVSRIQFTIAVSFTLQP